MNNFVLRTFKIDITPPVGMSVSGWKAPATGIETPLYLRGAVLSSNQTHYAFAAVDYCYTCGASHNRFVEAIAKGLKVSTSQVTLHSSHVHDAPVINEEAHAVMDRFAPQGSLLHDESYFSSVLQTTHDTIEKLMTQPGVEVSGIAFVEHAVEQFASTRRVLDENNKCHIRFSSCADADSWIKSYPEGRIDPNLTQIILYNQNDAPVTCLNFYASHPQVSNGRGIWSADTVGVALDLFEQVHPDVFSIYFTGCAGDVTAGKYTTNIKQRDRLVFGTRLFDAMHGAFVKAQPQPLNSIGWENSVVQIPLSTIPEDSSRFQSVIESSDASPLERYLAALKLRRLEEKITAYPFHLSRLTLNEHAILFLPTELIVDYQFHAKSRWPASLAVAAYGDCFLNYVAIDASFAQGGYEVQPRWTETGPGAEAVIKSAIDEILGRPL